MKILILAVGRPSHPALSEAIADFEERARRYFSLEVVEVPTRKGARAPEEVRRLEGRALLNRVPGELELFATTRTGKGISSRGLARHLERLQTYGRSGVAFALGGAHGLGQEVLERARFRLSLSPMTLSHELARLVLAEQIYRAGTLIRGEPYHKEGER